MFVAINGVGNETIRLNPKHVALVYDIGEEARRQGGAPDNARSVIVVAGRHESYLSTEEAEAITTKLAGQAFSQS